MPEMTDSWLTPEQSALIAQWVGLPTFVLRKYRACWSRLDYDTAHGYATDALVRAAQNYDPSRTTNRAKFKTYAIWCIYYHMLRANIADGVVPDKRCYQRGAGSFRTFSTGDDGGPGALFLESLADPASDQGRYDDDDERRHAAAALHEALATLPERTAKVLWLRIAQQMRLRDVAREIGGLSKERVRQIEREGKAQLAVALGIRGFGAKSVRMKREPGGRES